MKDGPTPLPAASRLYPPSARPLDPSEIYGDLALPANDLAQDPYTVINAVSTLDGRAAVGGKSSPIGGAVDRLAMRNLRCAVDAVLVGAGTLRRENLDLGVPDALIERRRANGLADQPLQVVLKGHAPLPEGRRLYESAGHRLLVLTPASAAKKSGSIPGGATARELPAYPSTGLPDVGEVLALLRDEYGVRRLLVEGGPSVNRSFLAGGHVSEFFLTLAPAFTGERDAPGVVSGGAMLHEPSRAWRLVSVYGDDDGMLYLRYRAARA